MGTAYYKKLQKAGVPAAAKRTKEYDQMVAAVEEMVPEQTQEIVDADVEVIPENPVFVTPMPSTWLITPSQAAEFAGVTPHTVYNWIKRNPGKFSKHINNRVYIITNRFFEFVTAPDAE